MFELEEACTSQRLEDAVKRLYVGVGLALEYASALWGGYLRRGRIASERVQLTIARCVLRCSCQDRHKCEVLRLRGWPTLAWRRSGHGLRVLNYRCHSQLWSEHISKIIQHQQFKTFVLKRLGRHSGSEDVVKR